MQAPGPANRAAALRLSPSLRIADLAVAFLALAAAYAYLHTSLAALWNFGLRYPFSDQYRIYAHFFQLPLRDAIWGIENAHRPIVAALIRLAEMRWAEADQSVQLAAGVFMALATVATMAVVGWRERILPASARAAAVLVAVLGVLWLGNVRMLFHGGEAIHVYPVTLATALAALCAYAASAGHALRWTVLGALCCTIATFSFGSGVASFAALFTVILVMRLDYRHWLAPAAILLADVILYLYVLPGSVGARGSLALQPGQNLAIALGILSSPWITADAGRLLGSAGRGAASLAVGAVGALAFAGVLLDGYRRGPRVLRLQAVGIAVSALGAATAVLIGLSRADYMITYPEQIFADRYLVWSSLFWAGLALYGIAAVAGRPNGQRGALVVSVLCVLGAAFLWKVQAGSAGWAAALHRINQRTAVAARVGIWDPDLFPAIADASPEEIRLTQGKFREHHWSMFRADVPALGSGAGRALDGLAPAPAGSAVAAGAMIADPVSGLQALRFEGYYAHGTPLPEHPEILVVDADGKFAGEAIPSFLPHVSRALRWNLPPKEGFDGYVVAPRPGQEYRIVLYDRNSGQPLHALPLRAP